MLFQHRKELSLHIHVPSPLKLGQGFTSASLPRFTKHHQAKNSQSPPTGEGARRSRMLGTRDSLTPKFIPVGSFHGPLEL